jgi:glycosyltransferase involved in cell wall biosynthesis
MARAPAGQPGRANSVMRLFINSLAASAGGGLTYIRNLIPHLVTVPGLQIALLAAPALTKELRALPNLEFVEIELPTARRFWYEQFQLLHLIRSWHAEVLLSAGNFAVRNSPVPQILLSRNSIYMSEDFYRDLLSRHEYRMWLESRIRGVLARKSVAWADVTVAPSEAFASGLRQWTRNANVVALHHGFDIDHFTSDTSPLPPEVERKLHAVEGSLKLLFVSHYNYYRNFETLIRALPAIRQGLAGRDLKLLLTCKLAAGENPGTYRPDRVARLVRELGVGRMVVEIGAVPYRQLHAVYRRADVYVTPAYTETFAHPLVEAMACGVPIVASDLPVHREICGDAALYFPRFSESGLAERVLELLRSDESRKRLRAKGIDRSAGFSWEKHAQQLLALAVSLTETGTQSSSS